MLLTQKKLLHLAHLAESRQFRSFPCSLRDSGIIVPERKLEGIQIWKCFQLWATWLQHQGSTLCYLSSECVAVLHGSSGKATWFFPAAASSRAHSGEGGCMFCLSPIHLNTSMLYWFKILIFQGKDCFTEVTCCVLLSGTQISGVPERLCCCSSSIN